VRGTELYVATIGPAEAYLIRQARLSTLPDPPSRARHCPRCDLEPDVWRGEISVGDSLVLVVAERHDAARAGELKDAMVTLHPQPAMEHLHHRFFAADGSGSDAMIAFEATEVASTHRSRTLVPSARPSPCRGARSVADPACRQRDRRRGRRAGLGRSGTHGGGRPLHRIVQRPPGSPSTPADLVIDE